MQPEPLPPNTADPELRLVAAVKFRTTRNTAEVVVVVVVVVVVAIVVVVVVIVVVVVVVVVGDEELLGVVSTSSCRTPQSPYAKFVQKNGNHSATNIANTQMSVCTVAIGLQAAPQDFSALSVIPGRTRSFDTPYSYSEDPDERTPSATLATVHLGRSDAVASADWKAYEAARRTRTCPGVHSQVVRRHWMRLHDVISA